MDLQFVCEASLRLPLYTLISWKTVFFSVFPPFFFMIPIDFDRDLLLRRIPLRFCMSCIVCFFTIFFFPPSLPWYNARVCVFLFGIVVTGILRWGRKTLENVCSMRFPSPVFTVLAKTYAKVFPYDIWRYRKWNVFKTRGIFLIRNFEWILLHKKLNNEGNPSDEVFENLRT